MEWGEQNREMGMREESWKLESCYGGSKSKLEIVAQASINRNDSNESQKGKNQFHKSSRHWELGKVQTHQINWELGEVETHQINPIEVVEN